jgi:hypothetical protein
VTSKMRDASAGVRSWLMPSGVMTGLVVNV